MTTETATPETGTVDDSASMADIIAEIAAGGDAPSNDGADEIAQQLVEEAENAGDAEEAAGREDAATEPNDDAETPPDEPDDKTEAEPAYKVTVSGEEVEVPLSELLKGYSRERDYTAKTMALAEERRQIEQAKANLEPALKAEYARELQQQVALFENADPVLAQARQMSPQQWEQMKRDNPKEFVEWQDAINSRVAMIEGARAQIQQTEQQRAEAEAQQAQQDMAEKSEAAAKAIVEVRADLAEPEAFKGFVTQTFDYARAQGFAQEELPDLVHPAALLVLDKARRFDEIEAAKASLPAKKVVPQPVVRPLTTDASDSRAAPRFRLPSNASVDRKAELIAQEILQGT